jgi:hypothetical protein
MEFVAGSAALGKGGDLEELVLELEEVAAGEVGTGLLGQIKPEVYKIILGLGALENARHD